MATTYVDEFEGSEVPSVPSGHDVGRLTGVEKTTTRFGDSFRWHWAIKDPSGQPFDLTRMTSTLLTRGSNAGKAVAALRGRALAPGERLPHAEIAGKSAVLEVTIDEDSGWNRIETITPYVAPAAPTAVADDGLPY